MKQPIVINESEAVFEMFYDSARSELARWSFSADKRTGASRTQNWQSCDVNWRRGGGRTVARMKRRMAVDISRYSHFMMRCNLPESCTLMVRVIVDGKKHTIINNVRGHNVYYDYETPLPGKRLQEMEIEIVARGQGSGGVCIFWLGLFDKKRRDSARSRPSSLDGKWYGLIRAEDDIDKYNPSLGMFFDSRELAALRRKVKKPYYREVMAQLRRDAESYLGSKPHRRVGDYPIVAGSGERYDRTSAVGVPTNERVLSEAMSVCGFVGLIDKDYDLLRTAISHALSAAHCTYWDDSFMMTVPGGCWDHRAFKSFAITNGYVRAWDWAGSLLTDAGITVMARAMSLKGLPLLHMSLQRHGYMRHCNQAIIFASGAILGEAALAKVWDYGGESLDVALAALSESVENYTEPDGGAHEGLAYFDWSYNTAMEGYIVAARHKGVSVSDIVPKCVLKTPDYLLNILSTTKPVGTGINMADGGKPSSVPRMLMLPRLLALTKERRVTSLWSAVNRTDSRKHARGGIDDIIYGPARLPKPKADPPVFSLLKHTGMLCSNRPTTRGPVRLQFIGAKAHAGHTHRDKGSFVLEAFGEEILIDRGICYYGDSRSLTMKCADQHNMLTPDDNEGQPLSATSPCRHAMIPSGKGDTKSLTARIDGTAQWEKHLVKWVRKIESSTPQVFRITDTVKRKTSGTVSFHLQSRFPWKRSKDGSWITQGKRAKVTVTPEWLPAEANGSKDGCDGAFTPIYHLSLRTAPALTFKLTTEIRVSAAS